MPMAADSILTANPDRVVLAARSRPRNTVVRGLEAQNPQAPNRADVPVARAPVAIAARGAAVAAVSGAATADPRTRGHGRGNHPVPDNGRGC